jgi:murein DD-endopeptidase MepM/ murein hydrolase activator NlpD
MADVSKPNGLGGNYVIVKENDGRYSMYMHLQQGSVAVKVGQKVVAGQLLGRVGASGDSLFPHLHYQRMEGPNTKSEGAPTRFMGVKRPDGSAFVNGYIDSGDIVIAD